MLSESLHLLVMTHIIQLFINTTLTHTFLTGADIFYAYIILFLLFLADCTSYTVLLYPHSTVLLTSTMHNTTHSTYITSTQ